MLTCFIGIVLMLTSILFTFINPNAEIFNEFDALLSENQKSIYKMIIKERISIYITGSIFGILLSILYYVYSKEQYKVCASIAIFYVTQLMYYKLYPKQPLMLYYLSSKEQVDKWADIYTYMKRRWHISFVISAVGYGIFSYSLSKS